MSAWMFAYSTIDHDFLYKSLNGPLSEDEIRSLELLRGSANMGEVAMEQFDSAVRARRLRSEDSSAPIPSSSKTFDEGKRGIGLTEQNLISTMKELFIEHAQKVKETLDTNLQSHISVVRKCQAILSFPYILLPW